MNTSKFILAITSAVLGAGLMFVVTDLTSSPAIEGWTPVNQAVASALVGEQGEQQPLTPSSEIKQEQNQSPGEKANANNEKSAESTKRVNINTAGLVELQNIPGVGEKKSANHY